MMKAKFRVAAKKKVKIQKILQGIIMKYIVHSYVFLTINLVISNGIVMGRKKIHQIH